MAVVALLLGRAATGQIIYDNGGPAHASGVEMTTTIEAEQFILSSPATFKGVHFWDIDDLASYNGSIVWTIYSHADIQPGAILFRGTATPTRTHTGPAGTSKYLMRQRSRLRGVPKNVLRNRFPPNCMLTAKKMRVRG